MGEYTHPTLGWCGRNQAAVRPGEMRLSDGDLVLPSGKLLLPGLMSLVNTVLPGLRFTTRNVEEPIVPLTLTLTRSCLDSRLIRFLPDVSRSRRRKAFRQTDVSTSNGKTPMAATLAADEFGDEESGGKFRGPRRLPMWEP